MGKGTSLGTVGGSPGATTAVAEAAHAGGAPTPDTRYPPLPTPDPDRRWGLSDLHWLLDGDWTFRSVADRIVASRSHVAVVITRRRGVYCATTKVHGLEYNYHQSVTLPGALAGVRRDLAREGF